MEQMVTFYTQHGWQLALIALLGIIILGVLKYANVFSKVEKEKRKPIYFAISIGFSLVATVIYLLIIKQFTVDYFFTVALAIYALNQAMYSVYETTSLRDLLGKLVVIVKNKIEAKKQAKVTENSENKTE
jgi:hypothetical protein